MASYRKYVATETAISMTINMGLSVAFYFLVFGGVAQLDTRTLIQDAIPQSFMIALMSTLVPTLLTRRRIATGKLQSDPDGVLRLPRHLFARTLLVCLVAVVVGTGLTAAVLLLLTPAGVDFRTGLVGKTLYGGLEALVVTPLVLRAALAGATTRM